MKKFLPVCAMVVLSVSVGFSAQEHKFKKNYDQDGVWWLTWDEGVKEAQLRNAPIHFTVHKDS